MCVTAKGLQAARRLAGARPGGGRQLADQSAGLLTENHQWHPASLWGSQSSGNGARSSFTLLPDLISRRRAACDQEKPISYNKTSHIPGVIRANMAVQSGHSNLWFEQWYHVGQPRRASALPSAASGQPPGSISRPPPPPPPPPVFNEKLPPEVCMSRPAGSRRRFHRLYVEL